MNVAVPSRAGNKWSMPRYKREWQTVCAVLPAYLADGTNGTMITYADATTEAVPYRIGWVVEDLLSALGASRAVLTKQSQAYLGRHARRVPLCTMQGLCLVPVKSRIPMSRSDAATGYVVLCHVTDVLCVAHTNRVYFGTCCYVTVYDTIRTLWHNLNRAKTLNHTLEETLWPSTLPSSPGA